MRAFMAAGIAAVIAGCSASDQVKAGKTGEPEPVSRTQAPDADASRSAAAPAAAEASPSGPVIVTVRSRAGTLTAHASEYGPLFTIATSDGVVEAEGLSYVELQDRYPEYYRAIRSSIAADGRMYAGLYDPEGAETTRDLEAGTSETPVLDARRWFPEPAENAPGPLLLDVR